MTILVPELQPVNAVMYWLLSRLLRIRALYVHPACAWLVGRGVERLDVGQVFDTEEGWAFRSRAVRRWEAVVRHFPDARWHTSYRGQALDFSTKAKQDLARTDEDFRLLSEIQRRHQPNERVRLVHSAQSAWVARVRHVAGVPADDPTASWLSWMNRACDRIWMASINAARLLRLLGWLTSGLCGRIDPSRRTLGHHPCIFVCDSEIEFDVAADKRSFTWVMDGRQIDAREVLVVLQNQTGERLRRLRRMIRSTRYAAWTTGDLYRRIPSAHLCRAVGELLLLLVRMACRPVPGVERLLMTRYLTDVIRMGPIVSAVRPACYVESDSSLGIEDPAIVYLNQTGTTTAMYHTSAMLLFYQRPCGEDVRDVRRAHVLASRILCWSQEAKRLFEAHPQDVRTAIEVLGPTLPGSERLLALGKLALRRRYAACDGARAHTDLKYVCVFDLPPAVARVDRPRSIRPYAEPFTEDYALGFLADVVRLLSTFEDLVVVYKPKRGRMMQDGFPSRWAAYSELVRTIAGHERGVVLASDVNPWIPIGMADVCVSVPGGSPPWVALHHGIPGLFHDPIQLLKGKVEESLHEYVTHDYETLCRTVDQLLHWGEGARDAWVRRPALRRFLGGAPGTNANRAFRDWLASEIRRSSLEVASRGAAEAAVVMPGREQDEEVTTARRADAQAAV